MKGNLVERSALQLLTVSYRMSVRLKDMLNKVQKCIFNWFLEERKKTPTKTTSVKEGESVIVY